MASLTSAIDNAHSAVAKFGKDLSPKDYRSFLAEVIEQLEADLDAAFAAADEK